MLRHVTSRETPVSRPPPKEVFALSLRLRLTARVPVLVLAAMIVTLVPILVTGDIVAAARTIHVANWGDDDASGTWDEPMRSVGAAVRLARSGDVIELRGGTYRESVVVEDKAVHIRSTAGERAVFEGSRVLSGFAADGGAWFADGWTTQFRRTKGGMVSSTNRIAAYPDQVFIDGRPQRQVLSRGGVVPGTFFHDTAADRIWVGDDPTASRVEVSALSFAFYFDRANGSRLTDVTVRRYTTEERHMAAIRGYADDLVFSGLAVEHNAFSGLSVIGRNIAVVDSRFVDNGFIGVHGHRVSGLVVERVAVIGNNKAGFDPLHSAAGLKVTASTGLTVRDSDVSRNDGPGIWTDLDTYDVTLSGNLVEANGRSGIEVELSGNVSVVDNIATGNGEAGVWILESQSVSVFHNAVYGNQRELYVLEGPRRNVRDIALRNNLVGRGRVGLPELVHIWNWTGERSVEQMNVAASHNAFWLPVDPDSGDFRAPLSIGLGAPVREWMAVELGVASGASLPIGPLSLMIRR